MCTYKKIHKPIILDLPPIVTKIREIHCYELNKVLSVVFFHKKARFPFKRKHAFYCASIIVTAFIGQYERHLPHPIQSLGLTSGTPYILAFTAFTGQIRFTGQNGDRSHIAPSIIATFLFILSPLPLLYPEIKNNVNLMIYAPYDILRSGKDRRSAFDCHLIMAVLLKQKI